MANTFKRKDDHYTKVDNKSNLKTSSDKKIISNIDNSDDVKNHKKFFFFLFL